MQLRNSYIIFLCYLLSFASAVQAAEHWIADEKTGCKIRNPVLLPDESISWLGSCKDGKASGAGKLLWYAKNTLFLTIEGIMEDGQCRHDCAITTAGGGTYLGELLDNRPHGSGTMNYADGAAYSGGWANGKKHGKGVFTAKDGSSQEELWEHGKKISDATH